MEILLDTHILLWALLGSEQLTNKARRLIESENNEICVSLVSIWEIQIKHSKYPQIIPDPALILDLCKKAGYRIKEINSMEIINIASLKYHGKEEHKDPFDRLLLSTAKTYGLTFLTADSLIPEYKEQCVISC